MQETMAHALGAVAHSKQPMLTVQLEKVQRSVATPPLPHLCFVSF